LANRVRLDRVLQPVGARCHIRRIDSRQHEAETYHLLGQWVATPEPHFMGMQSRAKEEEKDDVTRTQLTVICRSHCSRVGTTLSHFVHFCSHRLRLAHAINRRRA
jgi:hypothetical protein